MRKTLIAAAVIAAAAFAVYKLKTPAGGAMAELAYIPADTAVLTVQAEPLDMIAYLQSLGMDPALFGQTFKDALGQSTEPQAKFFISLLDRYTQALTSPSELVNLLGVQAQMQSLFYMVGVSPVMKLTVADEAKVWAWFDKAEQDSGFVHAKKTLDGHNFRSYSFQNEELTFDLLVSVRNGWLTIALSSDKLGESRTKEILALVKPAQSVADSKEIATLLTKYELNKKSYGYISTAELSKVLTTADGNRLAVDVNTLAGAEFAAGMAAWRTPACQQDVAAITNVLPGMYFDSHYQTNNPAHMSATSKMLFPVQHAVAIEALSSMRGFIPARMAKGSGEGFMQVGLGLDVGQLAAASGKLWSAMTEAKFTCEPLVAQQTEMKANNPLAALAMAGMANGVQGVSFSLNSGSFDPATAATSMDALVSISAANARVFFDGLKAMVPPLAAVTLPAEGTALDLTTVIPEAGMLGVKPQLIVNDSHLQIYVGDLAKAQAEAQAKEALSKNGLMAFSMDYAKFMENMQAMVAASGQPMPTELFGSMPNMQLGMLLDVNSHGLVMHADLKWSAKPKAATVDANSPTTTPAAKETTAPAESAPVSDTSAEKAADTQPAPGN